MYIHIMILVQAYIKSCLFFVEDHTRVSSPVAAKEQFQHCTRSQVVFLLGDIWLQQIVDGNCNHVGSQYQVFGFEAGDKQTHL